MYVEIQILERGVSTLARGVTAGGNDEEEAPYEFEGPKRCGTVAILVAPQLPTFNPNPSTRKLKTEALRAFAILLAPTLNVEP